MRRLPIASQHQDIVIQSQTKLVIEIRSFKLTITKLSETSKAHRLDYRMPIAKVHRRPWPVFAGSFIGISAIGLLAIGVSAAQKASDRVRYSITLPVPPKAIIRTSKAVLFRPTRISTRGHLVKEANKLNTNGALTASAIEVESYIRSALKTGENQEWTSSDAQMHFLTTGPAYMQDNRQCRKFAMLTRASAGASSVEPLVRCVADPAREHQDPPLNSASSGKASGNILLLKLNE